MGGVVPEAWGQASTISSTGKPALLDRLLYQVRTIAIAGSSYRMGSKIHT